MNNVIEKYFIYIFRNISRTSKQHTFLKYNILEIFKKKLFLK